jgi:hypothetical protein
LQPALSGFIFIILFVILELRKESGESTNVCSLSLSWRVVGRWYESQRRTRRKEREEIRGEFVGHRDWLGSTESNDETLKMQLAEMLLIVSGCGGRNLSRRKREI